MKNARIQLLVIVTCMFAAFLAGVFLGRNQNPNPVQIQALPAATVAAAAPTDDVAATEPFDTTPTVPAIININTATSEQLQTLPSIGPVLAERIITYRNEHGTFGSVTELLNVSGVGEKKLEAIYDLVTIGG